MDDEITLLRERVAMLEDRGAHNEVRLERMLSQIDAADGLDDGFIIPALLVLGGDALRERMLRWIERLSKAQQAFVEDEHDGMGGRELARLQYWQDVLCKREPWPDFPPGGWDVPREDEDREEPTG